ncbi:hypothetical protein K402DRAFT_462171 [Aulographum hederae CBS 113979]|uniref:Uncharacterized protein n=1 Tax=Aulographum hederae CBS 113979 TaxID=1176131 RepID=A0A6G1H5F4_9PEZI|nr:hypothetical protein K402DRAFT_462171 [Aulographum hederae CBS 113979]
MSDHFRNQRYPSMIPLDDLEAGRRAASADLPLAGPSSPAPAPTPPLPGRPCPIHPHNHNTHPLPTTTLPPRPREGPLSLTLPLRSTPLSHSRYQRLPSPPRPAPVRLPRPVNTKPPPPWWREPFRPTYGTWWYVAVVVFGMAAFLFLVAGLPAILVVRYGGVGRRGS